MRMILSLGHKSKALVQYFFYVVGLFLLLIYGAIRFFFFFEEYYILDDQRLESAIQEIHPESYVDYFEGSGHTIRYVSIGPKTGQVLFLIHGSPGNIGNRRRLRHEKSLYSRYRIVAPDRLGHGKSAPGDAHEDIGIQSQSLFALLESQSDKQAKPVVLGHSYGAPIAASMAIHHSNALDSVVLAAGALDPEREVYWEIAKVMYVPGVRHLLPFRARVAHREKHTHAVQLTKHMEDLNRISIPVYAIHGTDDILAPYENVYFLQKHIDPELLTVVTIEQGDHFQPFSAVDERLSLLQNLPQ